MLELGQSSIPRTTSVADAVERWPADSLGLLTGDNRAFRLSHRWMVRHYLMDKRVRIIDCAVRFDSISLVDELLLLGLEVDAVLDGIDIRRAFTPYQILSALEEIPKPGSGTPDVYYVLAPFKQFFDGDVAKDEAAYLLHELNNRLSHLGKSGKAMLVVESSNYGHAAFSSAYFRLRELAHTTWEILDLVQPHGLKTILRTKTREINNGTHDSSIQKPNGGRRRALPEVSTRTP